MLLLVGFWLLKRRRAGGLTGRELQQEGGGGNGKRGVTEWATASGVISSRFTTAMIDGSDLRCIMRIIRHFKVKV
jgi:hypothetical protein